MSSRYYRIVICPNCHRVQATTASRRFKCRFCGRSYDLRKVRILQVVENGMEVPRLIVYWRRKLLKEGFKVV